VQDDKSGYVLIVDFGSQYSQLIARKLREIGHFSQLRNIEDSIELIQKGPEQINAIVLSGGPQSVFLDSTDFNHLFKDDRIPILGICYGMQIITHHFGGVVQRGTQGEYGKAKVLGKKFHFKELEVWMSHFDQVINPPRDYEVILESDNGIVAGIKHKSLPRLGLQFHPEVHHTIMGTEVLKYIFETEFHISPNWGASELLEQSLEEVKKFKNQNILCAFSGGVDSLVAATLIHREMKNWENGELLCLFVNNGLLRLQDLNHIKLLQKEGHLPIEVLDVQEKFHQKLKGITDPEQKRKIIGATFIEVFEEAVKERSNKFKVLLQGTLYPDIIESLSPHKNGGKSSTIKSHHNVGGLPERMNMSVLEPLKMLFKDEVRILGKTLGLPHAWCHRHPFPGPGLGIRIIGEVTKERLERLQKADAILLEELVRGNHLKDCWQSAVIYLPIKTVGVKGDERAYEDVLALRLVNSVDGMTATWWHAPYSFLEILSARLTNEVPGVTRVVYDLTSKPPGTIEWE